jgi:hypothetical protein
MLSIFSIFILCLLWIIILFDNYKPINRIHRLHGYKLDAFLHDYGIHRVSLESDQRLKERAVDFFNEVDEIED